MKDLWQAKKSASWGQDPMQQRIYTSRLIGQESDLVLHGGGNTSLKTDFCDSLGDSHEVLYIKGSGQDLKIINAKGFSVLRLSTLRKIAAQKHLEDLELIRLQQAAMLYYPAPTPSLEAVLHAIIPYAYVDHTHADAVVTITNTINGKNLIRNLFGPDVLIIPYVQAGFKLARAVFSRTLELNWQKIKAIILMNHGLITFADDAKTSYQNMIELASLAENYLQEKGALKIAKKNCDKEDLITLAGIRKQVSKIRCAPVLLKWDNSPMACGFAGLSNVEHLAGLCPLTPDHVIRTKPAPLIIKGDAAKALADFKRSYEEYFKRHADSKQIMLDPAPRWGIWPGHGLLAFGTTLQERNIISDISRHTIRAIQWGEKIDKWQALEKEHIFAMEYWSLQQAKLSQDKNVPILQGKIALVSGAAGGIGLACAKALNAQGAVVIGLDLNPEISRIFNQPDFIGQICDVTDFESISRAVKKIIKNFGGLDIIISNAGVFSASQTIAEMDEKIWQKSLAVNLTSHQLLLKACVPYLKLGIDPAVVFIASKNVPAPGPGAAAYSAAKAGQTQLGRIAAMELGPFGIRVNIIHPNAVYDTALWTPEILAERAAHYGLSVKEYKTNNILKTEVRSKDVAALITAMVGPAFAKTTGAQIPIDGGNDRVI